MLSKSLQAQLSPVFGPPKAPAKPEPKVLDPNIEIFKKKSAALVRQHLLSSSLVKEKV